jgi:hypothetical protein
MQKNNAPRKTSEEQWSDSEEVWWIIRYLDPDFDHRRGDLLGILALLSIIVLICVIGLALHLRGL